MRRSRSCGRRRIALYRAAGVDSLQAELTGSLDERLTTLGTLLELCADPAEHGGPAVRYAEGPTVEVDVLVDAPPAVVWSLVRDVTTPARLSEELQEARWIDDQRFVGRSSHTAAGT